MIVISTEYNGNQLAVVQSDAEQKEIWQKYPIKLTLSETKAIQFDAVLSVLQGKDGSPATLAGIKVDQIVSPLVMGIEKEYKCVVEQYKELLKQATIKDFASVKHNQATYRIRENYNGFWWIWALCGDAFIDREQFNREAQAHRYTWLVKVGVWEALRMERIKNQIENALPHLIEQLEEVAKINENAAVCQQHETLFTKVWQIKKIHNTLFPDSVFSRGEELKRLLPGNLN